MYIVFDLGMDVMDAAAAPWLERFIEVELSKWSMRYDIPYRSKIFKGMKRVTFDQDQHYSLFALTWNPAHSYLPRKFFDFKIIEPMKLDSI